METIDISYYEDFEDELSENNSRNFQKNTKSNKKREENDYIPPKKKQNKHTKEKEILYDWEETEYFPEEKESVSVPQKEETPRKNINFSHENKDQKNNFYRQERISDPAKIREIHNRTIDFNKIIEAQSVENVYNGIQTYGIKFLYPGKKEYSTVVWFNQNLRERDKILSEIKQEFKI